MLEKIDTPFFNIHLLREGIYAVIAKPGQGAWSNAGIIDLGDSVVVFDAHSTPSAGLELRKQAEKLTGKKVNYLINSHYHGDHVFGNQAFEDTTIISTPTTYQWCKEKNFVSDVEKEKEEMALYLAGLEKQIEQAKESIFRDSLKNQYNEMSKIVADLSKLKNLFPSFMFDNKLIIRGSKREVELHCFGGGHTASDTFLYVPEEKILFSGDVVTEKLHVPIYNPEDFLLILNQIRKMDIELIIPGHGKVGDMSMLDSVLEYLLFIIKSVQEALLSKTSVEDLVLTFNSKNCYKEWKGVNGIKGNLISVYNFYKERESL